MARMTLVPMNISDLTKEPYAQMLMWLRDELPDTGFFERANYVLTIDWW